MNTAARSQVQFGTGFRLRWLVASSAGVVSGMVVFIAASMLLEDAVAQLPEQIGDWVFGLVVGSCFGGSLGVAQWLILRRYVPRAGGWITATTAAFMLACLLIFGLMDGGSDNSSLPAKLGHALVLGGSLGIVQGLVLRDTQLDATRWLAASLAGWIIAELAGVAATVLLDAPWNFLILFLVGGSLPGLAITWLARRSK